MLRFINLSIKIIESRKKFVSIDQIASPVIQPKQSLWECYTDDMTPEEKILIDLRRDGYKFHEICDILDETPSKVKNKFYKLIKRLREANAT